jgi:hypothetical protein
MPAFPLPDFVPVIAQSRAVSAMTMIEIAVGIAVLRVGPGIDLALLGKVIGVLKTAGLCLRVRDTAARHAGACRDAACRFPPRC